MDLIIGIIFGAQFLIAAVIITVLIFKRRREMKKETFEKRSS
jgi:hypothetical protein